MVSISLHARAPDCCAFLLQTLDPYNVTDQHKYQIDLNNLQKL